VEWVVANVPASGEDPADHDDQLGNVHVYVVSISDSWKGLKERKYDIKKRMGSKRAYFVRVCRLVQPQFEDEWENDNQCREPGEDRGRAWREDVDCWTTGVKSALQSAYREVGKDEGYRRGQEREEDREVQVRWGLLNRPSIWIGRLTPRSSQAIQSRSGV